MTTETTGWTWDGDAVVDPQGRSYYPYKQAFFDRLNALEACAEALRELQPMYSDERTRAAAQALARLDALRP